MGRFLSCMVVLQASFLLSIAAAEEILIPTPGTWGTVYFGYQNSKKEWVIPPRFTQAKPFNDGIAPVKEDGRWKVIDQTGKLVFGFGDDWQIADMEPYSEGFSVVEYGLQGFSCLVDRKGKKLGSDQVVVTHAGMFSDGLAAFSNYAATREKALFGYLDREARVVISPRFRFAGPFVDGVAPVVMEDGAVWFIGKNGAGKVRIEGVNLVGQLREGLAIARAAGTGAWGYVNAEGVQVIPFQYLEARSFFGNRAAVKIPGNHGWGFIDQTGKVVIPHQFDAIESFSNGRAWVIAKGDRRLINEQGEVVWSFSAEVPGTIKSPDDYVVKPTLPPETSVASSGTMGEPTAFLSRIASLKAAVPISRTVGDREVREYDFMHNRLRVFVTKDQVTRVELVALIRRPNEAKNVVRMRLEPGVGMVPVKGPGIDIEAEQASAYEIAVESLAQSTSSADKDGIRTWLSKIWQPSKTVTKSINGRNIFLRVANYMPWSKEGMLGSDKEGQLLIITCDVDQKAGFTSPAPFLPAWVIGVWAEQRNYRPTTEVEISDELWDTFVPAKASVEGKAQRITERFDNAFVIANDLVVLCASNPTAAEQFRERNFVVYRAEQNVLQVGAPGGVGYDRIPMRYGFRVDLVEGKLQVTLAFRGYPFHDAGLRIGDVVTKVNGSPVATVDEALAPFSDKSKAEVVVEFNRGGETSTVTVRAAAPR